MPKKEISYENNKLYFYPMHLLFHMHKAFLVMNIGVFFFWFILQIASTIISNESFLMRNKGLFVLLIISFNIFIPRLICTLKRDPDFFNWFLKDMWIKLKFSINMNIYKSKVFSFFSIKKFNSYSSKKNKGQN